MINNLHKLVIEHILLERMSLVERRVARTRSMGIELEFAANEDEWSVAQRLNSHFAGESAFGGPLEFGYANDSGKDRRWIVTTDPSAGLEDEYADLPWDDDAIDNDIEPIISDLEDYGEEYINDFWEEKGKEYRRISAELRR